MGFGLMVDVEADGGWWKFIWKMIFLVCRNI